MCEILCAHILPRAFNFQQIICNEANSKANTIKAVLQWVEQAFILHFSLVEESLLQAAKLLAGRLNYLYHLSMQSDKIWMGNWAGLYKQKQECAHIKKHDDRLQGSLVKRRERRWAYQGHKSLCTVTLVTIVTLYVYAWMCFCVWDSP